MLIIKFAIRELKITWFVNDNWVMLFSFLLTMTLGLAFRKIKNSKKKIKMPNPKGGESIYDCFDPGSVYELVDPSVEIVVKQMLDLPPEAGPLIISVPVLILAYIVSRYPLKQISIFGVSFFVSKFKPLAVKTAIGIASGSIFFFTPLGIVSLTSAVLAGAIALNVAQGITDFECNNLLSKVPMEIISKEKTVGFLDIVPEKTQKVFIKDNEDTELYYSNKDENGSCSSEYKQVEVQKSSIIGVKSEPLTRIHRKCEKEYLPLKARTKTLADLKKDDSTENRERAAPYIKRYENRRERIMNRRNQL